jgi:hypothetical protein
LKKFSLDNTKVSNYTNYALGPFFQKLIAEDIKDGFYSVVFDETTNNAHEKELLVQVRYVSSLLKDVYTAHLKTYYLDDGKATTILECIKNALQEWQLSLRKVVMLSSDGPNVNKTVTKAFKEEVNIASNI